MPSDIKNRLKEYMDKARPMPISREKLASASGVSFSTITNFLLTPPTTSGTQKNRQKIANALSELLGETVTLSDLFFF